MEPTLFSHASNHPLPATTASTQPGVDRPDQATFPDCVPLQLTSGLTPALGKDSCFDLHWQARIPKSAIAHPSASTAAVWAASVACAAQHQEASTSSLASSLPSLSERSLSRSSPVQSSPVSTAGHYQLANLSLQRSLDNSLLPEATASLSESTLRQFSSNAMSHGSDSPAQPHYGEDALNRWNLDRRDTIAVSNGQFGYDRNLNGGDSKVFQQSANFVPRESISNSNSLSPSIPPTPGQQQQQQQQGSFHLPSAMQDSYLLHRASISGPVMAPSSSYQGDGDMMVASAPPRAHGLAAWENASGSARPHTADGMFAQFGCLDPNSSGEASGGDASSLIGGGVTATVPRLPAGANHTGAHDPYSQQRRFSIPGGAMGPEMGGNKIFSYMPPMDEGMSGPGLPYGSGGYGSHILGGMGGFGNGMGKKRPRRRYDEIERLYPCKWPGCTKSYGTLNHLNAHVAMQKHGPKRSPSEFKDMRKAWRRQKKEDEQRRQARQATLTEQAIARGDLTRPVMSTGGYFNGGSSGALHGLSSLGHAPLSSPAVMAAPASRYSMSSVASNASNGTPYGYSFGQGLAGNLAAPPSSASGFESLPTGSGPVETRPYTAGGSNQAGVGQYPPGGLGAYLMSHRGSI